MWSGVYILSIFLGRLGEYYMLYSYNGDEGQKKRKMGQKMGLVSQTD
jgi:hypothetical protein